MSIRHAMLALLSEGPRYGRQLGQEFEACTGKVWSLNVGQVYTTLQRLERDGLVESANAPAQKGFRITDRGAEELAAWLCIPPDLSIPPRDELVIKILMAAQVPGLDVIEVIRVHRRCVVELMQQWARMKEDESRSGLGLALAVDAELFRLDSVLRWLDTADKLFQAHRGRASHADGSLWVPKSMPPRYSWITPPARSRRWTQS